MATTSSTPDERGAWVLFEERVERLCEVQHHSPGLARKLLVRDILGRTCPYRYWDADGNRHENDIPKTHGRVKFLKDGRTSIWEEPSAPQPSPPQGGWWEQPPKRPVGLWKRENLGRPLLPRKAIARVMAIGLEVWVPEAGSSPRRKVPSTAEPAAKQKKEKPKNPTKRIQAIMEKLDEIEQSGRISIDSIHEQILLEKVRALMPKGVTVGLRNLQSAKAFRREKSQKTD
jgi:hypothetical protein